MIQPRKKICLLVCSSLPSLQNDKLNELLKKVPELSIIADVKPFFVFGKSSVNITPEVWVSLAEEIKQKINNYDGFVIIHGVGNLLYTSSAISFLLQNLAISLKIIW